MFDVFKNKKDNNSNNQNNDAERDFTNPTGINFDNNPHEEVNNEGEVHNVADTRNSNSAQKGFFIICCAGLILLLLFMMFKSKVKANEEEQIQTANQVNKKTEIPNFELPPDPAPSENIIIIDEPTPQNQPSIEVTSEQPPEITPHEIRLRSGLLVSDNDGQNKIIGGATQEGMQQTLGNSGHTQNNLFGEMEGSGGNPLASNLNPTNTASTKANRFINRNLLLAKGTVIQCSLKTRIETQVAGMVACTTLRDTYSDNKKVLLIERGSLIEGEYQHTAEMGQTRIFVLWTRVRTPKGVVVNLNSPATDTLGGAGVGGHVKHHFWRRFGNALMFSLIQDGISTGFQRLEKSNTAQTIVYENSEQTTDDIVQEIIKSTSNIPPTIYKNQGDNAAVYVARDVDFSSVYSLRPRLPISIYQDGASQQ